MLPLNTAYSGGSLYSPSIDGYLRIDGNTVDKSPRNLIQEARRKDEERPLKERVKETRKHLDEAKKYLDLLVRNPWADTPEVTGSINRQTKMVQRLKAKLVFLTHRI